MTGRYGRVVIVLALAAGFGAAELAAQRAGPNGRMRGPGMSGGVEAILRMGERLGLTDAQRVELEALRQEFVEQRAADMAQMVDVRSRLQAGLLEAREGRTLLRELSQARRERSTVRRDRMGSLLTEDQEDELQRMRARMNRRGAMGRGGQAWNGGRPGFRGRMNGRGTRGMERPGFGRRGPNRGGADGMRPPRRRGPVEEIGRQPRLRG